MTPTIPTAAPGVSAEPMSDAYRDNLLESLANWLRGNGESAWAKDFGKRGLMNTYADDLDRIRTALLANAAGGGEAWTEPDEYELVSAITDMRCFETAETRKDMQRVLSNFVRMRKIRAPSGAHPLQAQDAAPVAQKQSLWANLHSIERVLAGGSEARPYLYAEKVAVDDIEFLVGVAAGVQGDAARLEWMLHNLSGSALRQINVIPASGGLHFGRIAIDAAIASQAGKGG